ncbi:MAG: YbaB/EbfC family nucleoid-associated protein [bacterium]
MSFDMSKMGGLLKKMQDEMSRIQTELENAEITGEDPSGKVKVKVNGQKDVLEVKIDPTAIDPDDVTLLEDLVLFAVKDALKKAEEYSAEKMGGLASGLPLPNIPGLKMPWK